MAVQIELSTPLADALNAAIQPKLEEHGWATGGSDDAALTEYIILMLVNSKTQDEVAQELSADLLGLDSDDPGLRSFCDWLFTTIQTLSAQFGASNAQDQVASGGAQGDAATADLDQDMDMTSTDAPSELNAYVEKDSFSYSWSNNADLHQTDRSKGYAQRHRRARPRQAHYGPNKPCDGSVA